MALTPSNAVAMATPAIDFKLADAAGQLYTLTDVVGPNGLLVAFICNHCPFVKIIKTELARLGREVATQQIGMVAINANDSVSYPEDSPQHMLSDVKNYGYSFPYLVDETQQVARAYQAACTPDFFLYNSQLKLVYHGQFDDARPGNGLTVTGNDLRHAIQALLKNEPLSMSQIKHSIGCNIKWKQP